MTYSNFKSSLEKRYWAYWNTRFRGRDHVLSDGRKIGIGPPVFSPDHRDLNVLVRAEDSESASRVRYAVPLSDRHRWFGSMHSSQALAQSVFANLQTSNKLALLAGVRDSAGTPVFFEEVPPPPKMVMEFGVDSLGEVPGRTTEIDVCFDEPHRICVECKFTEPDVGSCSRPKISPNSSNFERDFCDGSYSHQRGRDRRCSLSETGIRYWNFLPELLGWPNDVDHTPCPLSFPYQIVRNLLGACVQKDGTLDLKSGHVVLVYDERNPSFQPGGRGSDAWSEIHEQLVDQRLLRRCTWQQIVAELRSDNDLHWLTDELEAKYGF